MKTLMELKTWADEQGYKEFKYCYDEDDMIKAIDDLNQSRETYYDEPDPDENGNGHCFGHVTIELKRGLNYVTPINVIIECWFELWIPEDKTFGMMSYQYCGWE